MYTFYDKSACGYVQGMNFPAGMMVYHSCPSVAFCIFVKMLETHDIKSNYTPGLPGLLDKCSTIDFLIENSLPSIHNFLRGLVSFNH